MSIEQTDKIDAIGVDKTTGHVVLTISDHLSWDDEESHLRYLQDKLNTYIRFVESGQLLASYPPAPGRALIVDIVTRVEMPKAGLDFLDQARPILTSVGIGLRSSMLTG